MSELAKLTITPEVGSPFKVLFNPNSYSIGKGLTWKPTVRDLNAPGLQFGGGGSRSLSLDLFFDTTEETDDGEKDVRNLTNQIVALTRVVSTLSPPRPPICVVSWGKAPPEGSDFPFSGVVTELKQSFNLFLKDGRPVRANLTVTFIEYGKPESGNQGIGPALATRQNKSGDTLSSIAGEVYGDPTMWRAIAEANGLDDPRQVPVGLSLQIPKTG